MDQFIVIIIALAGLSGSVINKKSSAHFQLSAIIGIAIAWLSTAGFGEKDAYTGILLALTIMVVLGFFSGLLLRKYAVYAGLLLSLIPFVFLGKTVTYFDYELEITTKIAALSFLGALIPAIASVKTYLLKKWVGADESSTLSVITVLLGAFLVFFATFQAQYFGVILAGTGMLTAAMAQRSAQVAGSSIGLLSIGFMFLVLKLNPSIDTSVMRGNFLMGVVVGAGAIAWSGVSAAFNRMKWFLGTLISVLIVFVAVLLGIPNENFGGMPAFAGAVLGASVALFVAGNAFYSISSQALILSLIIPVTSLFVKQPEKTSESRIDKTEAPAAKAEEPDNLSVPGVVLSADQEGTWKSVQDKSKLEFKLGPEGGVTAGAFKEFKVSLVLDASGEPTDIKLDMNAASITTFNDMRDESVRGEGFMESDKHPKVTYVSKSFKKEGDRYFVTGEFEMLGKKQPVNLEIKFAAKGMEKSKQYLVMIGKSTIDRTKFGMQGDAKIGNEVGTTFEIEFQK